MLSSIPQNVLDFNLFFFDTKEKYSNSLQVLIEALCEAKEKYSNSLQLLIEALCDEATFDEAS